MKKRTLRYYHEWVQALPLKDGLVVCTKCNHRTKIGDWSVKCAVGEWVPISWLPKRERDELEAA